jgi:hypothetical protein
VFARVQFIDIVHLHARKASYAERFVRVAKSEKVVLHIDGNGVIAGLDLCFARIKAAFEMNNIQRCDVTLFMSCACKITIRQAQPTLYQIVEKECQTTSSGM